MTMVLPGTMAGGWLLAGCCLLASLTLTSSVRGGREGDSHDGIFETDWLESEFINNLKFFISTRKSGFPKKSWSEAHAICRREGGDLASITDLTRVQNLHKLVDESSQGVQPHSWIGLHAEDRTSTKLVWSDGSDYFEPAVKPPWEPSEDENLNDPPGSERLCTRWFDGTFSRGNCGKRLGFICQRASSPQPPNPVDPTTPGPGFCPKGFQLVGNKCLRIHLRTVEDGLEWQQALQHCRSELEGHLPDLASINTFQERVWLTSQLQEVTYGVWIGLRRYDNGPKDQWHWSDNSIMELTNWAPGEPYRYTDNCTEVWTRPGLTGTWNNLDCKEKRGFVCQTFRDSNNVIPTSSATTPHDCRNGYLPYWYGCYKVNNAELSWQEAVVQCAMDGGSLASIHSSMENSAIALLLSENDIQSAWIGYNNLEDGIWTWSDNWMTLYTEWAPGEPNDGSLAHCVAMESSGKWYNRQCEIVDKPSICKTTSEEVISTPENIPGECGSGWIHYGKDCFLFVTFAGSGPNPELSWEAAEKDCVVQNGTLATIHDLVENKVVLEQLQKRRAREFAWIGLRKDEDSDADYTWADGSLVGNYLPLSPDAIGPDASATCGAMNLVMWPGHWEFLDCTKTRSYVCRKAKGPYIPTTTPFIPTIGAAGRSDLHAAFWTICLLMTLTRLAEIAH